MVRLTGVLCVLAILFLMAPTASADGVTWTLNNLTFADGSTFTGSFVYDASTNTVTDIHLVSSAGTSFAGATYIALAPGFPPFPFEMGFVSSLSLPSNGVELEFYTSPDGTTRQDLTNAGGTVFADLNEFSCIDAACSTATEIRGTVPGGTVVGVVNTPEPSSLLLLLSGLLGIAVMTFRKTSL